MLFDRASVKELTSVAADLEIAGRSKMKKAELLEAVTHVLDELHAEAQRMNWQATCAAMVPKVHVIVPRENFSFVLADFLASDEKRLPRKLKKSLKKAVALL